MTQSRREHLIALATAFCLGTLSILQGSKRPFNLVGKDCSSAPGELAHLFEIQFPNLRSPSALEQHLFPNHAPVAMLESMLSSRIRTDYLKNRTLVWRGWWVAETELQLAYWVAHQSS